MNPTVILSALLVAAASSFGTYLLGRHDGRAAELATQAREDRASAVAGAAAASAAAEAITQIEVKHVTVRQQLETQVREVQVYRDCKATPQVVQKLNEALTGSPALAADGSRTAPVE